MSWFCRNPSTKLLPLKFLCQADIESNYMRSELQKLKGMMGAVIARAKQMTVWDGQNGAWDVPRVMQLYESMVHLFQYPTIATKVHWTDQISWRTVYNLYIKHGKRFATEKGTGIGAVVEANNDVVME